MHHRRHDMSSVAREGLSQDGSEDELRARLVDAEKLGVDVVKKRDAEAAAVKAGANAKPSAEDAKAKYASMPSSSW